MKKTRSTKSALMLSALSLLLCVSMLVGSTFAWFTDSVTSTNNIIKSGNLDVELYFATKAPENEASWKKVDANTNIFDETLWEPGKTQVVYFQIKNEGTLALKYNLGVKVASETSGINQAGDMFYLSEYIMFGLTKATETAFAEAYASREAARAAVASDSKLNVPFETTGKLLEKGKTDYLAMVVYMPETVGNVANYKTGTNAPEIHLGINLFATQLTHEEDTYGPDYDGGANWLGAAETDWYFEDPTAAEFVIGSSEELAGLAAIVNGTATAPVTTFAATTAPATVQDSFAGKTIKLTTDLNLAGKAWTPIGTEAAPFKGTFDGQEHTISNLYVNNMEMNYVGLFGYVNGKGVINNVNINNVNLAGYSQVGSIAGRVYTGSVSNCHVTGSVKIVAQYAYAGGIVGGDYVNLTDCSVIADPMGEITVVEKTGAGGICGWHTEGAYDLANLHVKNLNITAWGNLGGITGFVHYQNVINNCSVENVNLTKTREDGHPSIGIAAGGWSYNATNAITITNNTFKNITLNGTAVEKASANYLYGSEYSGADNSNFVLDNNTESGITNNLIYVKEIKTVADLTAALTTGGDYVLKADLDLTETITVPAGVEAVVYMNGKTINGSLAGTGNKDLFLVKGNLTVKNGTITLTAVENQGWGAMAAIFDITAGGSVTLDTVNATVSGTDMSFVAHLNNWGTASLIVDNSTLKSNYVPVRVFNSGYDLNTVTINNSVLDGGSYSFWVHNYTSADFGGKVASGSTEAYDEAKVAARLNFDIIGNGNTFISGKPAPIRYGMTNSIFFSAENKEVVLTADALQAKLDAATGTTVITLGADITGDVVVLRKANVDVIIDGAGHKYTGLVTLNGHEDTGSLTIKNINFVATANDKDAVIFVPAQYVMNGNTYNNYVKNVTVDNCTFTDPANTRECVAILHEKGGKQNWVLKDCTVDNTMHSFLQASNLEKSLVIDGCKVYSKNGVNLNYGEVLKMTNCTFDVTGYAVRIGVKGATVTGNYSIEDSNLKSACAESDDAVIVFRGDMAASKMTITNTTLTGTRDITGTATVVR